MEKYIEGLRADVFCKRGGRNIAFEIQLSPIPLKIIDKRVRHYRNREEPIYLFWIKKYDNSRLAKDIKMYGGSENLYEFCDGYNLFKCHYRSYRLGYRDGLLKPILVKQEKEINLADLWLDKDEPSKMPYVINLEKQKVKYEKVISDIEFAVEKRSKKMLEEIDAQCRSQLSKNECIVVCKYIDWLKIDMDLLNKNAFYMSKLVHFKYIKEYRSDIRMKSESDCSDPEDPNTIVYSYYVLPCPFECRDYYGKEAWDGFIVNSLGSTQGKCRNCSHESDLIDYLYKYDKVSRTEAAQEICKKLYIPYGSNNKKKQPYFK